MAKSDRTLLFKALICNPASTVSHFQSFGQLGCYLSTQHVEAARQVALKVNIINHSQFLMNRTIVFVILEPDHGEIAGLVGEHPGVFTPVDAQATWRSTMIIFAFCIHQRVDGTA